MDASRQILVVDDAAALASTAAQRVVTAATSNPDRVAVCLTGGSTPKRLYELLATPKWRAQLPWTRIDWFIGDERFVPQDDPNSNIGMARKAFLDTCATPGTVHAIRTDLATPEMAADSYEKTLKQLREPSSLASGQPLFDLVLMGVGPDGHTASLFPNYPATHETHRWVVGVPEAHVAPFVPRVTLTFPALASSREMLFLVSGEAKREIVMRVFEDDALPAARARSDNKTVWLMDRAAAPERS